MPDCPPASEKRPSRRLPPHGPTGGNTFGIMSLIRFHHGLATTKKFSTDEFPPHGWAACNVRAGGGLSRVII